MSGKGSRPLLITIIAVLYILAGLLALVVGVVSAVGIEIVAEEELAGAGMVIGGVGIVYGLISLVIGYGMIKGWAVMWYLGVIFSAIGLILSILAIVGGGFATIVTALIELVILLYLFKKNVKAFFLG